MSTHPAIPDAPVEAIQEYLETLPPAQTGTLWVDEYLGQVVVQLTEHADIDAVRAEAQRLAADAVTVVMEVVRYSGEALEAVADRIAELPGLEWSGIGAGGADGCVEVTVTGDVDEAARLMATIADPCS